MGVDWQQLVQSIIMGLIFSFLLAKLISFITSFNGENSATSKPSNPVANRRRAGKLLSENDPEGNRSKRIASVGDMSEIGSMISDDISMFAEKGSIVGGDVRIDDVITDDVDDDWEGIERTELDEAFSAANAFIAEKLSSKGVVSKDAQLQLYGLYKIATEGPCSGFYPPPKYKVTARAKWNAWQKLGAMPPEDAMQKYVDIVSELFPSWKTKDGDSAANVSESKGPMGPVFSSVISDEESGNELKMDAIHTFAREGDVDNLVKCTESSISLDSKDSKGRTPLHWAVDRGHLNVIGLLLSKNADVNAKDIQGQTPLHYAIVCDREAIAEYLVKHNADLHAKDHNGTTPMKLCEKNWAFMHQT